MKNILLSTRPKWCEKICHEIGKDENGKPIYEKRIEVRKTAPKEVPFKVLIYATRPKKFYKCGAVSTSDELLWFANGKVEIGDGFKFWADGDEYQCLNGRIIGEFVCDRITDISVVVRNCNENYNEVYHNDECKGSCLTWKELQEYGKGKTLYGWHISDLKIYDKPKELSEFKRWNRTEENSPCAHTKWLYPDCKDCKECNLTRPPQSWCYVEEA